MPEVVMDQSQLNWIVNFTFLEFASHNAITLTF
jgi:hypothetical protein